MTYVKGSAFINILRHSAIKAVKILHKEYTQGWKMTAFWMNGQTPYNRCCQMSLTAILGSWHTLSDWLQLCRSGGDIGRSANQEIALNLTFIFSHWCPISFSLSNRLVFVLRWWTDALMFRVGKSKFPKFRGAYFFICPTKFVCVFFLAKFGFLLMQRKISFDTYCDNHIIPVNIITNLFKIRNII